jgi:hypothetical protein
MAERALINLTEEERALLLTKVDLTARLDSIVSAAQHGARGWGFTLSPEDASEIRERCSESLMEIGFNQDDTPTKNGLLLESMIDKFFVR